MLLKKTKISLDLIFNSLQLIILIRGCGVMGPKSYNGAWGFGQERGSPSPRRNISLDQLKHGQI